MKRGLTRGSRKPVRGTNVVETSEISQTTVLCPEILPEEMNLVLQLKLRNR
jgi:hypothetical protein